MGGFCTFYLFIWVMGLWGSFLLDSRCWVFSLQLNMNLYIFYWWLCVGCGTFFALFIYFMWLLVISDMVLGLVWFCFLGFCNRFCICFNYWFYVNLFEIMDMLRLCYVQLMYVYLIWCWKGNSFNVSLIPSQYQWFLFILCRSCSLRHYIKWGTAICLDFYWKFDIFAISCFVFRAILSFVFALICSAYLITLFFFYVLCSVLSLLAC